MKTRELTKMGYPRGGVLNATLAACRSASESGKKSAFIRDAVRRMIVDPEEWLNDPHFGAAAALLVEKPKPTYDLRDEAGARELFRIWGEEHIDTQAIDQMVNALSLPVSVGGALMPDAHLGYGIPIGGVLATEGAVIPYAVGVDIACRMMMSVLPIPVEEEEPDPIEARENRFIKVIERNTRFGLGAKFKGRARRQHEVMDRDWNISPFVAQLKKLAWDELGTSGGGNHFVDVGELEVSTELEGLPPGKYVAILSHSGSRGPGNKICSHYSRMAQAQHPHIPRAYRHLAWLSLSGDGEEYWAAMELMGHYASANHHCIHATILADLGLDPLLQLENHHNYAWKENHGGREVIVHRKGATPAAKGDIGIIPGSMATPGFVVEGRGEAASYDSAAHGAGRVMSRKKGKEIFRWNKVRQMLRQRRVKLVSAGLDEVPGVYKDIESVMAAQADLVQIRARFDPRIVKMADDGFVED